MATNNMPGIQRVPSETQLILACQRNMPFLPPLGHEHAMPMFIELGSWFATFDTYKAQKKGLNELAAILSETGIKTYRIKDANATRDLQDVIHKSLRQLFADLDLFNRLGLDQIEPLKAPLLPFKNKDEPLEYRTNFKPEAIIGSGGFATVYKVSNVLDNQEYALKQIDYRHELADAKDITFKEVQLHAKLNHPNIVAYKSTWTDMVGYVQAHNANTTTASELSNTTDSTSLSPVYRVGTLVLTDPIDYCYLVLPETGTDITLYMGMDNGNRLERVEYELMARLYIQMELCNRSLKDRIAERNHYLFSGNVRFASFDVNLNLSDELKIFKQVLNGVAFIHSENVIHRDLKPSNILLSSYGQYKIDEVPIL